MGQRSTKASTGQRSQKQVKEDVNDDMNVDFEATVADQSATRPHNSDSENDDEASSDEEDAGVPWKDRPEDKDNSSSVASNDTNDSDDDDEDGESDKEDADDGHVVDEHDDEDEDDDSSVEEEQDAMEDNTSSNVDNEQHKQEQGLNGMTRSTDGPSCTFDLRNLLALSTNPIDPALLYAKNPTGNNQASSSTSPANEMFLLQQAQTGCQQLLRALWQLPVERQSNSNASPLVVLPLTDESRIPRALPPPPPKQDTKWEKFAREKGIGQNKDKRSRKVWDEATGEWMYRHGFQKANNDTKEWPIMEAVPDDPMADPWERQREVKRSRVDKNAEQRLKNQERSGMVAKGSAKRLLASNKPNEKKQQTDNNRRDALPVGVPVDLAASGRKGNSDVTATAFTKQQRGQSSTLAALRATQVSTASLGKFDKMRQDEPERRRALQKASNKKRKFQSATDKNVLATESERSLKLLTQLNRTGGKDAEVARKKGRLATGETAYDYDYSDGLGPSSFRKKKGRAGAGKMKKMTKKRAK